MYSTTVPFAYNYFTFNIAFNIAFSRCGNQRHIHILLQPGTWPDDHTPNAMENVVWKEDLSCGSGDRQIQLVAVSFQGKRTEEALRGREGHGGDSIHGMQAPWQKPG